MFVIVGWLVVMGCVFGVFIVHGGNIMVVLKALPFELITIGGATWARFWPTTR
jgi:chemotaxis protein MotA